MYWKSKQIMVISNIYLISTLISKDKKHKNNIYLFLQMCIVLWKIKCFLKGLQKFCNNFAFGKYWQHGKILAIKTQTLSNIAFVSECEWNYKTFT